MSSETPSVTARGDAIVRTEPDEALLWVTLSALRSESPDALADVAARAEILISLLDEMGISAADRSTSGVTVQEEFEHTQDGRRSLGQRATSVTSIRVTELKLIGELISRTTGEVGAHVAGPQWQIAPGNPARLEAARQAAADGRRKARAYAEALGAGLGRLIEVSEPENPSVVMRASKAMSAGAMGAPMPIEPGEMEVSASVRVTFALNVGGPAA